MVEELVYSLKKTAGERLRLIREAIDFSRRELGEKYKEKYGLSASTLKNWEEGRWGGLTLKGAEKLLKAFQDEGVDVTTEWLLHGVGQAPSILEKRLLANKLAGLETTAINHELQVFYYLHSNAISMKVVDDGMAPCLQPGDHVAGIKYSNDEIQKIIGLPCIVQTNKGQMLVRLVEQGNISNRYNLTCANSYTTVNPSFLENVELFCAAPVIWIRKPEIDTRSNKK